MHDVGRTRSIRRPGNPVKLAARLVPAGCSLEIRAHSKPVHHSSCILRTALNIVLSRSFAYDRLGCTRSSLTFAPFFYQTMRPCQLSGSRSVLGNILIYPSKIETAFLAGRAPCTRLLGIFLFLSEPGQVWLCSILSTVFSRVLYDRTHFSACSTAR